MAGTRTELACLSDALRSQAYTTALEVQLNDRSVAYGRLENGVRSAIWQLQHGSAGLALEDLQRAIEEAASC